MGADEFQEELSPTLGVEFGRPIWQRYARDAVKQPCPAKRRIGQNCYLAITCQRQNSLLNLAIINRVVDAGKIERLGFYDRHQVVILPGQSCGDVDVANSPLGLQILQKRQLSRHIAQVVNLDEIYLPLSDSAE